MILNFLLAESALEIVPQEIRKSPAVVNDSKGRGVDASRILLDRSIHLSAMSKLDDAEKRGRPDLVHSALLSVTGTPLYLDGKVKVFIHTYPDAVLEIQEKTRIPKNYLRFRGLAEQALSEKPERGLVRFYKADPRKLIRNMIGPDLALGLSTQGKPLAIQEVARMVGESRNPCLVVGGFPHGHFSPELVSLLDRLVRVHDRPLEAHVVASRVVYEVEKA